MGNESNRTLALQLKQRSVETEDGCWEWQGSLFSIGYASVPKKFGGGGYGHRAMYGLVVAPIPNGMYVLHSCDNRKCINPAHLSLGTHLDNIKDMHSKNRQRGGSMPNEKNPYCHFSNEVINQIRADYKAGKPKRDIERQYGISETHYYRVVKMEVRLG